MPLDRRHLYSPHARNRLEGLGQVNDTFLVGQLKRTPLNQKPQRIPAQEELEKLLDHYPWISQRRWASFFGVSSSTFNGWVNKNAGVPEDKLRVIRMLNHVETKKRQAVTKLMAHSGIVDFVTFITSIEHLSMKSDWLKFFGSSLFKGMNESIAPGSLIYDLIQKFRDKDEPKNTQEMRKSEEP